VEKIELPFAISNIPTHCVDISAYTMNGVLFLQRYLMPLPRFTHDLMLFFGRHMSSTLQLSAARSGTAGPLVIFSRILGRFCLRKALFFLSHGRIQPPHKVQHEDEQEHQGSDPVEKQLNERIATSDRVAGQKQEEQNSMQQRLLAPKHPPKTP
jgi:hypothetical protein